MHTQALSASIPQSAHRFHAMRPAVQSLLLALNRDFYASVAVEFDRTRLSLAPGIVELMRQVDGVGRSSSSARPRVLDAGCGNGRFAWALEEVGIACDYIGVDNDPRLLALAREHTSTLAHVKTRFVLADLAGAQWVSEAGLATGSVDLVVCLATLQHVPGYTLRARVVEELAALLSPGGTLALSAWQFLSADRFVQKQLGWETLGLSANDVEPGDALLPWRQGGFAVRYVHQVDETELQQMANEAGLTVKRTFRADGKEGNLNLYAILKEE